jgi:hypothetical protein
MDWEELLRQTAEREAAAEASEEPSERRRLFKEAANLVQQALPNIPDLSERGNQALRIGNLLLQAGRPKKAKQVIQELVERNSLPDDDDFQGRVETLLIELTNITTIREAKNRSTNPGVSPVTINPDNPSQLVIPQNPNILDELAAKILAVPLEDLRRRLAQALQKSISIDIEHSPPRPMSPSEIASDIGIPISTQRQNSICLTKNEAFEFLSRLEIAPKRGFKRNLTKAKYEKFFGRKISSDGGKPYVFTYAEILHFVELDINIPFPDVLRSLLG